MGPSGVIAVVAVLVHVRTVVARKCSEDEVQKAADLADQHPDRWMRMMHDQECGNFSQRRLVDTTLIGSHDSGAYWLTDRGANCGVRCTACEAFPQRTKDWGLAQAGPISQQLQSGHRVLDFRLTVDPDVEGCWNVKTITAKCWKLWHCVYGHDASVAIADLADFLKKDMEETRRREVVIVNLDMGAFEAFKHKMFYDYELTQARVDALVQLLEAELGTYIYDEPIEQWWMVPMGRITASGKRLIIMQYMNSWWHKPNFNETRFRTWNDDNMWGGWIGTCCQTKVLASGTREKQEDYAGRFLKGLSWEEALASTVARPMLRLSWTMTYLPINSMVGDNGTKLESLKVAAEEANPQLSPYYDCSGGLPMFGNVIYVDWMKAPSTVLRVAVQSSLAGPRTKSTCPKLREGSSDAGLRGFWNHLRVPEGVAKQIYM